MESQGIPIVTGNFSKDIFQMVIKASSCQILHPVNNPDRKNYLSLAIIFPRAMIYAVNQRLMAPSKPGT
jgi:hypothetical protein